MVDDTADRPDAGQHRLPRFAVIGLAAQAVGSHGSSSASGKSSGWTYEDEKGRFLQIEVGSRSDSSITEAKERSLFNMVFPLARAIRGDDLASYEAEVERVTDAVRSGTLGWREDTILVDGRVTGIELLDLGNDFWIALALLPDCLLSVSSHGVPRDHVELARTTDGA